MILIVPGISLTTLAWYLSVTLFRDRSTRILITSLLLLSLLLQLFLIHMVFRLSYLPLINHTHNNLLSDQLVLSFCLLPIKPSFFCIFLSVLVSQPGRNLEISHCLLMVAYVVISISPKIISHCKFRI